MSLPAPLRYSPPPPRRSPVPNDQTNPRGGPVLGVIIIASLIIGGVWYWQSASQPAAVPNHQPAVRTVAVPVERLHEFELSIREIVSFVEQADSDSAVSLQRVREVSDFLRRATYQTFLNKLIVSDTRTQSVQRLHAEALEEAKGLLRAFESLQETTEASDHESKTTR